MTKHRAVIIGAGRIGAGYQWLDDEATHAGAYRALKDRVELVGFVEPVQSRAEAACRKWKVPAFKTFEALGEWQEQNNYVDVNVWSVCVQPANQPAVMEWLYQDDPEKGVWCEKPFVSEAHKWTNESQPMHIQVNYQRRADPLHRKLAERRTGTRLIVYGYDNETTRCHFTDLARFWNVPLEYRKYDGPCSYVLENNTGGAHWFDNGGVNSGECFRLMLENLLDAVESKAELWSPPY